MAKILSNDALAKVTIAYSGRSHENKEKHIELIVKDINSKNGSDYTTQEAVLIDDSYISLQGVTEISNKIRVKKAGDVTGALQTVIYELGLSSSSITKMLGELNLPLEGDYEIELAIDCNESNCTLTDTDCDYKGNTNDCLNNTEIKFTEHDKELIGVDSQDI